MNERPHDGRSFDSLNTEDSEERDFVVGEQYFLGVEPLMPWGTLDSVGRGNPPALSEAARGSQQL